MTSPCAVARTCGRCGYAGSPTIRIGAMLESNANRARASTSRAHGARPLIDHSGARKPRTSATPAAASAARLSARSAPKLSGVSSYTRRWRCPCEAISWPARAISRTSVGCRAATQPSTKNVARAPHASNRPSTSRVVSTTRLGSLSQCSKANGPLMPQTWNHSSTSTVRQLRIGRAAIRPAAGTPR